MEFPYGHPHHHPGRYEEDSSGYPRPPYPPPPPPSYGGEYPPPPPFYGGDCPPPAPSYGGDFPPPHVTGVYHTSHTPNMESPNFPPNYSHQNSHEFGAPEYGGVSVHHTSHTPQLESPNYPPPPQQQHYPSFGRQESEHESHESGGGFHRFKPHVPSFISDHFHHSSSDDVSHENDANEYSVSGVDLEAYFANKPAFKIYCKAGDNTYSVAIRDEKVVLTYTDPTDPTQHWYKDEKFSTKVKDEDGYPSFSLVNKATGQVIKHSASGHPVQLVPFKPDCLDVSVLWTESKDLGSGFRTIRMVNNTHLVLDAFNGDEDHGGVHDGTYLALFRCWKGDNKNQQWKLYPHSHE